MRILEEILSGHEINDFARSYIKESKRDDNTIKATYMVLKRIGLTDCKIASQAQLLGMNPETIERNYQKLSALGLKDDKIASQAHLLGRDPETIERNYQKLSALGLKDDKIASQAQLLGMNPETIEKNYQRLSALGLKDDKIATLAQLLGRDPETIERNYQRLSALGLKDDKIASRAELLGMNPETIERNYQKLSALGLKDEKIASQVQLLGRNQETIERNYQHHIGLLRQNHQDRASGRDLLFRYANLLGISPETINANVQYLYDRRIDYNNGILLSTTTQIKRKKISWLLREVFDYKSLNQREKKRAILSAYSLVREKPQLCIYSIATLEKKKHKLREKAANY